jgi:hypothetical protein
MTEPLTQNRVDIKAILADPLLREELIEGATDFICKVEGIRRKGDLKMIELSPAAQAVLDGFRAVPTLMDAPSIAGALRAVVQELKYFGITEKNILAIAAELEDEE